MTGINLEQLIAEAAQKKAQLEALVKEQQEKHRSDQIKAAADEFEQQLLLEMDLELTEALGMKLTPSADGRGGYTISAEFQDADTEWEISRDYDRRWEIRAGRNGRNGERLYAAKGMLRTELLTAIGAERAAVEAERQAEQERQQRFAEQRREQMVTNAVNVKQWPVRNARRIWPPRLLSMNG